MLEGALEDADLLEEMPPMIRVEAMSAIAALTTTAVRAITPIPPMLSARHLSASARSSHRRVR